MPLIIMKSPLIKKEEIKENHPNNSYINIIMNCKEKDICVDLNRNYDYFFVKDNERSSNRSCQEDYRDEYPFSESETRNLIKLSFTG